MIKRLKSKTGLIYLAIAVIVILRLIFGKSGREDIETLERGLGLGEKEGSGFLEVETFPGDAEIYVDGILRGKSPDTLYSIPAGMHNIAIKKEGYADYSADVNVEAGKKAFVEAELAAEIVEEQDALEEIPEAEEVIEEAIEEAKPIEAIEEEEKIVEEPEGLEGKNIINIGTNLQFYYDFSDEKFTDSSNADSDVFSRRFDTYIVFTRFSPVNIKAIGKKIEDVKKEDCIGIKGTFEYLY